MSRVSLHTDWHFQTPTRLRSISDCILLASTCQGENSPARLRKAMTHIPYENVPYQTRSFDMFTIANMKG